MRKRITISFSEWFKQKFLILKYAGENLALLLISLVFVINKFLDEIDKLPQVWEHCGTIHNKTKPIMITTEASYGISAGFRKLLYVWQALRNTLHNTLFKNVIINNHFVTIDKIWMELNFQHISRNMIKNQMLHNHISGRWQQTFWLLFEWFIIKLITITDQEAQSDMS